MSRPAGAPARAFTAAPPDPLLLVTAAGSATGARAVAAGLASACSDSGRAALVVALGDPPVRPTPLSTAAARTLEERLAAHLPGCRVAARGRVCLLGATADGDGIAAALAAASLPRGTVTVIGFPQELLQQLLVAAPGRLSGLLLRADLRRDRALVALAARDVHAAGLRLAVLKRPLSWSAGRRAALGLLPATAFPGTVLARLGIGPEREGR